MLLLQYNYKKINQYNRHLCFNIINLEKILLENLNMYIKIRNAVKFILRYEENMKYKKIRVLLVFGMVSIFFLSFLLNSKVSFAQSNGKSLTRPTHIDMTELTDDFGMKESNSSIKIPLPSSTWNVSHINLNFTDIKLEREINPIEDNTTVLAGYTIGKEHRGLGVQLNITEPTKIFGVSLYGTTTSQEIVQSTKVQITGYDSGGLTPDSPNTTIYGSTDLNMSTSLLGWYRQMFRTPIDLSKGQYYLTLNCTQVSALETGNIYWFYNEKSPVHPELHISFYVRTLGVWHWTKGILGTPFLHKIIQRTDKSYYPESINMTAEINSKTYNITNGLDIGTGNLAIKDLNYNTGFSALNIKIHNNNSVELIFNLTYHLNLKNLFVSHGSVLMQANHDNNWTLTPIISSIYINHSVKFDYPANWFNPKVYRNGIDISSQVNIDTIGKVIFIPNNTIIDGAYWEITANSPNVALTLNTPKKNFEQSQDLKYSVIAPSLEGNYTFLLIDSLGYEIDRKLVLVTEIETVYNYTLSANPNQGTYVAYVFWNTLVAAGVKLESFLVNIDITFLILLIAVISGSIIVISAFSSFKVVKKVKRNRTAYRQSIFNKYMDILNLDYLIIIEKNTGINIYDKIFASKSIDASLISGFLEAIRSFGLDLTGSNQQSQTVKLEYQDSKILMSEFKNFRTTLIMKESPSEDFLESIKQLSYDIDQKYGKDLERFDGEVGKFSGITDIIEHHLPVSLIYPLQINEESTIRLSSNEKEIIDLAKSIMEQKGTHYFFVSNLISQKGGFQAKQAEVILNLIEKKVFDTSIKI